MDPNLSQQIMQAAQDLDKTAAIQADLVYDVPNLDAPVFMVRNYSPDKNLPPVSLAFDCQGSSKCWLPEPQIEGCGSGNGPQRNAGYLDFSYQGHNFYGYSIKPVDPAILCDVHKVEEILLTFYDYVRSARQHP